MESISISGARSCRPGFWVVKRGGRGRAVSQHSSTSVHGREPATYVQQLQCLMSVMDRGCTPFEFMHANS